MARVLVIDDEPSIRHILRFSLEAHGYEVIVAEDGQRGVAMARRQHPDVIVLDLMMPVMDGHMVLDALRSDERTEGVPTVVLTALVQEGTRDRCTEQGAAVVMTKPFDPGDVVRQVDAIVAA
ncbi:MAG: response regulator [Actinomycetota bacterium]